ncbi:HlyD family type I secretion periplasmic adaptor subunit [Candidatus Hamiltonella defensa]|uniref:HlyD family type I secretion periplasmic adaptor subunit n=1 Tax=Candidatus Williamhamiltonella defendens TaxID=138072 RepID=UPI0015814EC1|nr:HlyD family type I secretion periplasmic adaptor subunit [Candidatus Hamiltonella defensa]
MNRKQTDTLMMMMMMMSLIIIIAASIIKVNSVIHGQGMITNRDNTQFISLSKGGVIEKIYVSEGESVKRGALLAKVINLDLRKEYERLKAQKAFLVKDIEELTSLLNKNAVEDFSAWQDISLIKNKELSANIELVKSQIHTKTLKLGSLESEITGMKMQLKGKKEQVALLGEEVDILHPLVKKGITSYTNYLNKKQAFIKLKSEMDETENNIILKKNDSHLVKNEIRALDNELRLSLSRQLSKDQQELNLMSTPLKIFEQQIEEENVRAPVNGVIYKINKSASTQGGVIQAADLLFEIKPSVNTMQAEIKVNPKYRDQLYVGEQALVDILSLVKAKGKFYQASIEKISPDSYEENTNGSVQRYYKVIISFNVKNEDMDWLKPGMAVDARVVTGKHSIMSYLISPLTKGISHVFSEPVHLTQYNKP